MAENPKELHKFQENESEDVEDISEEIEIITTQYSPKLLKKTFEVLQSFKLCHECLGRQFSYLATATDNNTRAQAILLTLTMEAHAALKSESIEHQTLLFGKRPIELLELIAVQSHFFPAYKVLADYFSKYNDQEKLKILKEKWSNHVCDFCQNLLTQEKIEKICKEIEQEVFDYDFDNFLIGTYLNPLITNKEEDIRARFHFISGESFKANLNRLVGKKMQEIFHKPTQYNRPDLQIMIDLRESLDPTYELQPKPLYLESKYKKFVRNLPQTHWHCPDCRGRGIDRKTKEICPTCHGSGDMYASSIEDLIASVILPYVRGEKALLHGAGREDIDARCLGKGRPFIMEIKKPQKRILPLDEIQKKINNQFSSQIYVEPFTISSKKQIIEYKSDSEFSQKAYHALIFLEQPIDKKLFDEKMNEIQEIILNEPIHQRTPLRVVHRRADKTRTKKIFEISGKWIDSRHIFLKIRAQGGTYIKELISSDNGRTVPSIAQVFKIPMTCVELDIVNVDTKNDESIR
ncbi:MAG: tRNA pseudouridine(54/55) synthase Pus10 [Candidatus Lokiarchaeota archaeon]|nr:tRNA pseudouridine(54/55) synthase Pus10 [Candidatus Harpocratesius repetitus]